MPHDYSYRVSITDTTHTRIEKKAPDGSELGKRQGELRFTGEAQSRLIELQQMALDGRLETADDADVVRELGELLFNGLFDDRLSEDFFSFYYNQVRKDDALLRFEISVDETVLPEIAALPWEFLVIPVKLQRGVVHLATTPDIIVSRWRSRWDVPKTIAISPGEKLRIGIAIAAPSDLGGVKYDRVLAQIQAIAQAWSDVELLPIVENATSASIDQLLAQKPHIFHFIGHGRFNGGKPQVALVDEILGEADWCESQNFAELFNRYSDCVVILQTCESATLSSEDSFVGIASDLVQQAVPIVVAMQYEIKNVTAQRFVEAFYRHLFSGDPVDVAVQEGRREIGMKTAYRNREFATPVMYVRAHRLFRLPMSNSTETASKTPAVGVTVPGPFRSLIEDKTANFVGRQYIFDDINHFLNENPKGYCILEGDPGAGKTAIMAKFVHDTKAIAHFNIRSMSINKPHQYLESVCRQLVERYQLPYPSLPAEATRDGGFLMQLLSEASDKLKPGERLIIAIDALDEVDSGGTPGNILYLPPTLPNYVYFVMSTRRFPYALVVDAPTETLSLNAPQYNQGIDRDIRQYIFNATGRYDLQGWIDAQYLSVDEFVTQLAFKSEQNFIYLTLVLGDIEKGRYENLNIERLPKGLEQYYDNHWNIMGMRPPNQEPPRKKLRVIYVICELREPVSRQLITEFAQTDGLDIDELTVQSIIDEWYQFMHEQQTANRKIYSLYHTSFREFLHRKDVVQLAAVTIEGINKLIADNLWKDLFGDKDI